MAREAGSAGAKARTIARAVCDGSFVAAARVIKSDGRTSVFSADAAGYPVVVKTLALDRLKDRAASATHATRLWRQARGVRRVLGCGVLAAEAYAIARGRDASGHRVEALIIERIEGPTLLRAAAERSLGPRPAALLLDRLGTDIGALAAARVINRDHKPSNLIVATDDSGMPRPVLIDTADIRRRGSREALEMMLAKLLIEAIGTEVAVPVRDQVRIARAALRRAGEAGALRELLDAVRDRVDRHGDPTPKDDPLAFDA